MQMKVKVLQFYYNTEIVEDWLQCWQGHYTLKQFNHDDML